MKSNRKKASFERSLSLLFPLAWPHVKPRDLLESLLTGYIYITFILRGLFLAGGGFDHLNCQHTGEFDQIFSEK